MIRPGMALTMTLGLCSGGCGEGSELEVVGPGMAGTWSVTDVDGEPVPEGSSIDIEYRRNGEVLVEEFGRMKTIPPFDKEKLKESFEQLDRAGQRGPNAKVQIDESQVSLKRKTPPPPEPGS